jgi:L-asparaginase
MKWHPMKTVLFVFTGGTISMKRDPVSGAAVPALSGREILAYDPSIRDLCAQEVIDYGRFPGPHITPARMWEISEILRRELARPEICGAVVTHGTDTLEETAYFLDLRHRSPKPVVLVGAMRNSSELSYDGPANLHAATRVAMDDGSREKGVLVVLNQTVHAAAEATKIDTQAVETYESPVFGALGLIDNDRVLFARQPLLRDPIDTGQIEERVDLIEMYAGADGRFIDFARESGAAGIVVNGTGRGNVPPAAVPAIQRAIEAGVAVVIASRCVQGRILDTYGYEGSGRDLRQRGVIFAGTLSGAKARLRLMLALGRTHDLREVRDFMERWAY